MKAFHLTLRDVEHFAVAFAAAFATSLAALPGAITVKALVGAAAGAASVVFRQVVPTAPAPPAK